MYDSNSHKKSFYHKSHNYSVYPDFSFNHHFESNNPFLISTPRVIRPTFPPNLSSMHVCIYPNDSKETYDLHVFDMPNGLETDITLIFYKEHDIVK